jgi:hypothetical protein
MNAATASAVGMDGAAPDQPDALSPLTREKYT